MNREKLLYDILDQLTPSISGLKNITVDIPKEMKEIFLGLVITQAVISMNLYTSTKNSLQSLWKKTTYHMMLNNAASFFNSQCFPGSINFP